MSVSESQDDLSTVHAAAHSVVEAEQCQMSMSDNGSQKAADERSDDDESSSSGGDTFHPDSHSDSSIDDRNIEQLSESEDAADDEPLQSDDEYVYVNAGGHHENDSHSNAITNDAGYTMLIIVNSDVH